VLKLNKHIDFYSQYKGIIPDPQPAISNVPSAYKKMKVFQSESFFSKTVKKCIPFLDALTCGYIIPFPMDQVYRYDKENTRAIFETNPHLPSDFRESLGVSFHENFEVSENLRHNKRTVEAIFKFINPWVIKTPPGYSCIFTQPFNRNLPFKIIDGVVDTDTYTQNIHFPFYWTNPHTERVILESGSPMVLVIPFKRDSWRMRSHLETPKDMDEKNKKRIKFNLKIVDMYKKSSWKKKSFR
jgi:hypothetical protein